MKKVRFTAYCCEDRHAPHVLVAVYDRAEGYTDVVNVRGADRVIAACLPAYEVWTFSPPPCHLAPHRALGANRGRDAAPTIPNHRDAHVTIYPIAVDPVCDLHELRPMTVKPGRRR